MAIADLKTPHVEAVVDPSVGFAGTKHDLARVDENSGKERKTSRAALEA